MIFVEKIVIIFSFQIYNWNLDQDPDPNWAKILDPNPNSLYLDHNIVYKNPVWPSVLLHRASLNAYAKQYFYNTISGVYILHFARYPVYSYFWSINNKNLK